MEFQYADGQLLPFGFMCCPNNDQGLQLCPTVYRMCIRRMSKQLHNRALNLLLNQRFLCCENGNDLRQLAKGQSYWLLAITADLYCYWDSLANQRASAKYLHIRNPICILSGTCVVCVSKMPLDAWHCEKHTTLNFEGSAQLQLRKVLSSISLFYWKRCHLDWEVLNSKTGKTDQMFKVNHPPPLCFSHSFESIKRTIFFNIGLQPPATSSWFF